ncbi:MAG TPA: alpha,alpha-trehalose-phosphate synthase (UDP-forming) [Roseiarcus sp.]|nr:alpha,alpha-trehalose-phosphate synthase (UDP-forming) [Roseiarcus sp.]
MAPRLILVSNRVNVPAAGAPRQAGGLTVAVNAALKQREGVWFGWSGKVSGPGETPAASVTLRRRRTYITLDLSETDFQEYYNGFANRVLWPVLHYRVDLAEFTAVDLGGYLRVNSHFADALSPFVTPDDVIWVHDYHLLPFAKELRERGHNNPIGFFLHIPCPPPDMLNALPHHDETMGALNHYDLVGLQTDQDADNLSRYFLSLDQNAYRGPGVFEFDSRRVRVRAFPVSIATAVYARAARNSVKSDLVEELHSSLVGKHLILGVDRLDYSKGIRHRIQAFGHFLEKYPEWLGKVTFLQVTPKSRVGVPEYAQMDQEISALVGQINGRYGDPAWTPIRYINRSYSRAMLAGLYRAADVGLVTPLRDGMNLVAKEYVAAQDPDDPGVLVLSQFAGAAQELGTGALIVNPHESEAMAAAIKQALEMPLEERKKRFQEMYEHLAANDIDKWAERFLSALGETREQPGLLSSLRQLFAARA